MESGISWRSHSDHVTKRLGTLYFHFRIIVCTLVYVCMACTHTDAPVYRYVHRFVYIFLFKCFSFSVLLICRWHGIQAEQIFVCWKANCYCQSRYKLCMYILLWQIFESLYPCSNLIFFYFFSIETPNSLTVSHSFLSYLVLF